MNAKILFVDDEQKVLNSIKRSFYKTNFKIETASSGAEGLEILSKDKFDLVISDVRMPEMDGITFLKKVKDTNNDVNRVVLSGQVDEGIIIRSIATGICFDYMTKPWDPNELISKINKILDMRTILKNSKLMNIVNHIELLPHTLTIMTELEEKINSEDSLENICKLIEKDISITSKIMQIANSAFYGTKEVSTLKEALIKMGLRHLRAVVAIANLTQLPNLNSWQKEQLGILVDKTLRMNNIFPKLYQTKFSKKIPEEYEFMGLFSNIGLILLLVYFPDRYKSSIDISNTENINLRDAQIKLGWEGETHIEIGAYFLKLWNFPKTVIEASLALYYPELCEDKNKIIYTILSYSDKISSLDGAHTWETQQYPEWNEETLTFLQNI